jgi:hypothetical protein
MCETLDQSSTNRIGGDRNDNGDRACRLLGGLRRRRVHCDNDIHVEADKFDSKCKETLRLTLCVSVLDANVLSLEPSEVRKTLSKGVDLSRDGGVGFAREKAYSGSLSRLLLRAHREWRGYCAADERDEFPPLHGLNPEAKDQRLSIAESRHRVAHDHEGTPVDQPGGKFLGGVWGHVVAPRVWA